MIKCCNNPSQFFAGENTGPGGVYWCENCGSLIDRDIIKTPNNILTKEEIQTIKYAEECLNEELSLGGASPYKNKFRPRWEKLLKKLGL